MTTNLLLPPQNDWDQTAAGNKPLEAVETVLLSNIIMPPRTSSGLLIYCCLVPNPNRVASVCCRSADNAMHQSMLKLEHGWWIYPQLNITDRSQLPPEGCKQQQLQPGCMHTFTMHQRNLHHNSWYQRSAHIGLISQTTIQRTAIHTNYSQPQTATVLPDTQRTAEHGQLLLPPLGQASIAQGGLLTP